MAKLTLQPNQERTIPIGGLFLSIVNASTAFAISGDFGRLVGEVGRVFEMNDYREAIFINESDAPIDIEYEVSNIKVHASGKGLVAITNAVEVTRIQEAIQVNANATVENGKMALLPPNNFEGLDVSKSVISEGQTFEIFPARNEVARRAIIQLITESDTFSKIRIGTSALNVDNGVFLAGNLNAPAAFEFDTQTPVFVKNIGVGNVTLAGCEQWRA
tara:strand:+ start:1535 stop:2185 length:651 start_codon:yes stop_codon:yes gene_type:complete